MPEKKAAKKDAAPKKKPAAKKTTEDKAEKAKKAVTEKAQDVKDAATETAKTVADTVEDTKDSLVDKAKKAYDEIPTDEFHEKADEASKKVAETAKKAGEAVKGGFADHGIDTEKLGSALKQDAKNVATTVVGGAKFASEKFGELMDNLHEKLAEQKKDDTDADKK